MEAKANGFDESFLARPRGKESHGPLLRREPAIGGAFDRREMVFDNVVGVLDLPYRLDVDTDRSLHCYGDERVFTRIRHVELKCRCRTVAFQEMGLAVPINPECEIGGRPARVDREDLAQR